MADEPTNLDIHTAVIRMEGKLDTMQTKQGEMSKLLTGNGKPSDGVVVQLDRVKQRMKIVWGALAAAFLAVVRAFWSDLTGD